MPSMDKITERLLHEERKRGNETEHYKPERKALTVGHNKGPNSRKQLTCYFCKQSGHFRRDCLKYAAHLKQAKGKRKESSNAVTKEESSSSSDKEALLVGQVFSVTSQGNWIVDSGATCHMCNDQELFGELNCLQKPQKVSLGDGHELDATHEGTVTLEMLLPDGCSKKCKLSNVLFVPKLSYSLLSVSKASESGKTTKFTKTGCEILNKDNKVIAFATTVGSLYYLEFCRKPQLNVAESERLWHRRYGHLGEKSLQKLAKREQFDYNVKKNIGFCEACIGGKLHRSRFEISSSQTKEPLEVVHSDVCGKLREKSIGGAEYFLTFIDDYTRYTWVYPLKTKDQVFMEWKALVEKSVGKKLKTFRTDNGGEYTSNQFEDYLKGEGIRHECTIPKTPEQNGVAERLNRTLVESARSMLLDAKLPHKFWAEAVSTAAYLRNRCPTKAVKGMTPYEALTGNKPKVEQLRVFGCDVFAHVPKDERSKLDSKARKCILLGYGQETKGYRLFDTTRGKVIYSRDVKFNESPKESNDDTTNDDGDHHLIVDFSIDCETETENVQENVLEPPVLRRSTRERHSPNYYAMERACHYLKNPYLSKKPCLV